MAQSRFWHVRHGFNWYKDYPTVIAWHKKFASKNRNWRVMKKEDKIIYSSAPPADSRDEIPKGIVGLFRVVSDIYEDSVGNLCYNIEPLYIPKGDEWPMPFSPKNDLGLSLKPMGTIFELKPEEYRKIKSFLLGMNEPENHEGVVTLFSKVHRMLGYPFIKTIRQGYPDAEAGDYGKEKKIEFEFDSADFLRDMEKGNHDPNDCDAIVCWKDGWGKSRKYTRAKRLKMLELEPLYGS